MTPEELDRLSDEELEQRFFEAKAELESPETQIEEEYEEVSNPEEGEAEEVEFDDLEDGSDEYGSEQPEDDQDSDHDASEEADEEVESEEDTEANPDEEAEETAEGDTEEEVEAQPTQSYKFKANGKEYEFTEQELKEQFPRVFGQAMDYTKKMQAIKPWRKTIDAIEQAKLSHEDINLMIDVLKGDKDAIAEVIKRTDVDVLDLNMDESKYVAKDYGRDDTTLAIKDILDDISRDPEYVKTESILGREWDDASWKALSSDPEKIRLLHLDVKSGIYDRLQPIMEKFKVYDGGKKTDLEYYAQAAQSYSDSVRQQEMIRMEQERVRAENEARLQEQAKKQERLVQVKAKEANREAAKNASAKRKAAAPTKNGLGKADIVDYLDSDDEAWEEWYKRVTDGA